eukprot:scaffold4452_cov218-Pinguiococcus_pyrenoidosus.AAC.1
MESRSAGHASVVEEAHQVLAFRVIQLRHRRAQHVVKELDQPRLHQPPALHGRIGHREHVELQLGQVLAPAPQARCPDRGSAWSRSPGTAASPPRSAAWAALVKARYARPAAPPAARRLSRGTDPRTPSRGAARRCARGSLQRRCSAPQRARRSTDRKRLNGSADISD